MKPFFTNSMLVEMNTEEVETLRVLVANQRNKLLAKAQTKEPGLKREMHLAQIEYYDKMYKDLTKILQIMPFKF